MRAEAPGGAGARLPFASLTRPAFLSGAIPALALALSGCAPTILLTAKSPDRRHDFEIRQAGGRQEVLKDGRRLRRHAGVAPATLALGGKGSWAYAARAGSGWRMLRDGRDLGTWDGIGGALFAPGGERLAFTAERGGKWSVVVDGEAGPGFDAILAGTLRFDPQGAHFAYAARRGGRTFVARDREIGPALDGAGSLAFSPEGGHLAYAARSGEKARAVLDGVAGPEYDAVAAIAFLPPGDRLAYLARRGSAWHAVVEGVESRPYPLIRELAVHPRGTSTAFVADAGAGDFAVVDGIPAAETYAEIRPGSLCYRDGDAGPSYLARRADGRWIGVLDGAPVGEWDEVTGFARSADGKRLGFAARSGSRWSVWADGAKAAEEGWAGRPALGPGGALAYPAIRDGRECAVAGGRAHCFDAVLADTFAFGPGGAHWGCLGGDRAGRSFFFVLDGARGRDLDVREIVALNQRGVGTGQEEIIRGWVAAEIAREVASALPPAETRQGPSDPPGGR